MDGETGATYQVGAAAADITPPLAAGILMSSVEERWEPFAGVRKPLQARAVVIAQGRRQAALVSLDLLGLTGRAVGGMARFRTAIAGHAGRAVRTQNLILAATHTHTGPESLALTDLYKTEAFQSWVGLLAQRIGTAIRTAAATLRPCVLQVGTAAEGPGIYRRFLTTEGILLSHPPPPPETVITREGPTDPAVSIAAFREPSGPIVALLVNATCHPVHEMCLPQISPDYPGEMSEALERRHPGATALFLNGAAGNINPSVVSGGPDYAVEHGRILADTVDAALPGLRPVVGATLTLRRRDVRLPRRTERGEPSRRPLRTQITALRLGDALFVFLPGEPFVETGLAMKARAPFGFTAVVGYAESSIGYIPTERAFEEGGYEIGPGRWSYLGRGCEEILRYEAGALVDDLA